MASPQRQGPHDPLQEMAREPCRVERVAGEGNWWLGGLGLWVVVGFCVVALIWFAGWGFGGYGGWWWGPRTHQAKVARVNGGEAYGEGTSVLNADNKQAFAGQPFSINDVAIVKKTSDGTFWIGSEGAMPLFVVLQGGQSNSTNGNAANSGNATVEVPSGTIAVGNRVNITGTVERAPADPAAMKNWALSLSGASRLTREGVYVAALQVKDALR